MELGIVHSKCSSDLNRKCPKELQVRSKDDGQVIACLAFNKPEYCCTAQYNNPSTCKPTNYSQYFKNECPTSYSYPYDDATTTFTLHYHILLVPFFAKNK